MPANFLFQNLVYIIFWFLQDFQAKQELDPFLWVLKGHLLHMEPLHNPCNRLPLQAHAKGALLENRLLKWRLQPQKDQSRIVLLRRKDLIPKVSARYIMREWPNLRE